MVPNRVRVEWWGILSDEWWVMSDENWVTSDEWWKIKIQTGPKHPFLYSFDETNSNFMAL